MRLTITYRSDLKSFGSHINVLCSTNDVQKLYDSLSFGFHMFLYPASFSEVIRGFYFNENISFFLNPIYILFVTYVLILTLLLLKRAKIFGYPCRTLECKWPEISQVPERLWHFEVDYYHECIKIIWTASIKINACPQKFDILLRN